MTEETKMHIEEVKKVYPDAYCSFYPITFCAPRYYIAVMCDIISTGNDTVEAWKNAFDNLKTQPNGI